uniref:Uncharacterized protein n=1 Tax=Solanum lycopersicum TaxID=4081 RepID=A0A3Q7GCZ6_SOLLC
MHLVGPHGQFDPFSRSYEPRSAHTLRFLCIRFDLMASSTHFQGQTSSEVHSKPFQ